MEIVVTAFATLVAGGCLLAILYNDVAEARRAKILGAINCHDQGRGERRKK